jgi:hypothetical protein
MEHKRLPRGAKQVSQWVETSSESYPKGYNGEITLCYYEADIAYPAVKVVVYDNGKQIYSQAFYGETADMDARRNGNDATTKAIYAKV